MAYEDTEFIDRGFPPAPVPTHAPRGSHPGLHRAPTREELDSQVTANQHQMAKLLETQQQLERARAELELMRRRRTEFQVGRTEVRDALVRGVSLLEKAEFAARRDAEQMAKSLVGLRESLTQVEDIREEEWSEENWTIELGRSLNTIENARLEWNTARLKWPILDGKQPVPGEEPPPPPTLKDLGFWALCRIGLAFSWPLLLISGGILAMLMLFYFKN